MRNDFIEKHPELYRKLNWAREQGLSTHEFITSTRQYELQENSERLSVLIKLDEREELLSRSVSHNNLQSKKKLFKQEWNRLGFRDRLYLKYDQFRGSSLRDAMILQKQINDKQLKSPSSNFAISRLQLINQQLDEDLSVLSTIEEN